MPEIALLHSRQRLRPSGADEWVRATVRTVDELAANPENRFLCSVGSPGFDLTLSLIAKHNNSLSLIYAGAEPLELVCAQYGISPARIVSAQRLNVDRCSLSGARLRDEMILQIADRLFPISLRPGGFFDSRISEEAALERKVDCCYRVGYKRPLSAIKIDYSGQTINQQTALALNSHLIHWTKTTNTNWPSETVGDFYRALAASDNYPRSALATLRRIAGERLLRKSNRHMPTDTHAVGFTAAGVADAIELMNYRGRDNQMSFEPYGVALPLALAERCGIQPVRYVENSALRRLSPEQKKTAHALGSGSLRWDVECEWRTLGDLDLRQIWDQLVWLTPTEKEAKALRSECSLNARSVFSDCGKEKSSETAGGGLELVD